VVAKYDTNPCGSTFNSIYGEHFTGTARSNLYGVSARQRRILPGPAQINEEANQKETQKNITKCQDRKR